MGIDTFTIALIFTILGIGVFISFRILNITDLTVEASYGFGAVVCGLLCSKGLPYLGLLCAFLGGSAAGLITSLLHTKLKINAILSGVLTLTAFYSINLIVSDSKSTIALKTYNSTGDYINLTFMPDNEYAKFGIMVGITALIILLTILFFKTKLGMSIRACGDNDQMTKMQCISTDLMKIIGLALSNGLVALAGALFVQFQGSYSTSIERGIMVVGVATIIIGEIVTFRRHSIWLILIGILVGSVIFRVVYGLVLNLDFIKPRDLQLIQAVFLVIILCTGIVGDRLNGKLKLRKANPNKNQQIKNDDEAGDLDA